MGDSTYQDAEQRKEIQKLKCKNQNYSVLVSFCLVFYFSLHLLPAEIRASYYSGRAVTSRKEYRISNIEQGMLKWIGGKLRVVNRISEYDFLIIIGLNKWPIEQGNRTESLCNIRKNYNPETKLVLLFMELT